MQFKLMLVMSELKEFSATDIDYRIVLRHMPDCPLYMERKAGDRFKKVFEGEYEAWVHQRSAEQSGHVDPWRLEISLLRLDLRQARGRVLRRHRHPVVCSPRRGSRSTSPTNIS